MGRGRKNLIEQSIKRARNPVFYDQRDRYVIKLAPIGNPVYPTFLPAGFIDSLKQMDPKALAKILLE